MNGFKKICSFIILTALFFTFIISPKIVQGIEAKDNRIEAIFVLDSSNSMKQSDPKNIRMDAFKLFVDMCHVNGDSIGLVAFGEGLAREVPPIKILNQGTKEDLKKKVENIPLTDLTDIGLGLKKAVESFSKDSTNAPLIILLSDGKNDPKRPAAESEKDINDSIEFAKKNGIPIYTIGLNANGLVDQNLLEKISRETGGESTTIENANKLPSIFGEIFVAGSKLKMMDGPTIKFNEAYQDLKIDIPDENVVEGNIAIMSEGISEIKVFDEKGAEQPIDNDKIQVVRSKNYSMVKFIYPQSRNWVLRIKGVKGNEGTVSFVYNYNLDLESKISKASGLKSGEKINISASLMSNGKSVTDSEFYKGLTGKLIIKDNNKNTESVFPLNNTGSGFDGEYQVGEKGDYELKVRVDGSSLYRESEPVKLGFEEAVPSPVKEPDQPDNRIINKLRENWTLAAGGSGILLLLCILVLLRNKNKKNKKKIKEDARIDLKKRINPEVNSEVTITKEVITLSEAVKMSEAFKEEVLMDETLENKEVTFKKEPKIERDTTSKEGKTSKKESKIVNGEFSGQIMITIKERDKEETFHPVFKNLIEYSNSINLSQLLSDLPEFKEMQKINFYPGVNGSLVIKNLSTAVAEKNGIDIKNSEVLINNEEKVSITLKKTAKTIYIQYFRKR